jgi:pilus assembly protein CpaF
MSSEVSTKYAMEALRPIETYLNDPRVVEVMINGPNKVFIECHGERPIEVDVRLSESQLQSIISLSALVSRREVDLHGHGGAKKFSIVSAKLPHLRFEAQLPPVAVDGPYISIRKHNPLVIPLEDHVAAGVFGQDVADYLRQQVRSQSNILVAGGTSSGKTTFLNTLVGEIPDYERLFVIETVPELQIKQPNVVRLEADDEQGASVQRLVKSGLRSRPDRFLVGEVRGPEAFDLMDAANTGHPGTMASLHANSPAEALDRFENLILEGRPTMPLAAIRTRIAQTFKVVVQMSRVSEGGRVVRRLGAVIEVDGIDRTTGDYVTRKVF